MKLPKGWRKLVWPLLLALLVLGILAGVYIYRNYFRPTGRWALFAELRANPQTFARYTLQPGQRCGDAPFAFPTRGVILGLWDQSFRLGHRHAGVDIFSGTQPGITPVYAAYPGYLTRQADWRASVIIRIPSDPLQPGRQVWTYYTHLANQDGQSFIAEEFPPGTEEVYVEAGTFLGYMGNYSGDPGAPTGLHLHFSVVKDEDGEFLNELDIRNTYDPSPYFGLALNHRDNPTEIPLCEGASTIEPWELRDASD
ncbi:MAG: M23 family metallopeptidase [Anaerolineales bacterium]|nr:M23 family metallopeptidase [Anaerolineales bacterium]